MPLLDRSTEHSMRRASRSNLPTGRAKAQALASHRGGLGSFSGHSTWNLWWTKWHWDRFFSEFFSFPLSVYHSTVDHHTHISRGARTTGTLMGTVQRHSPHPIVIDNNNLPPVRPITRQVKWRRQYQANIANYEDHRNPVLSLLDTHCHMQTYEYSQSDHTADDTCPQPSWQTDSTALK
jgi:hypothetical protein